jgi:hypothetical protein
MSDFRGLGELTEQIREASRSIEWTDSKIASRSDELGEISQRIISQN